MQELAKINFNKSDMDSYTVEQSTLLGVILPCHSHPKPCTSESERIKTLTEGSRNVGFMQIKS